MGSNSDYKIILKKRMYIEDRCDLTHSDPE